MHLLKIIGLNCIFLMIGNVCKAVDIKSKENLGIHIDILGSTGRVELHLKSSLDNESKGKIFGFYRDDNKTLFRIGWFQVDEKYRCKGHGTRLLQAMLKTLKKMGCSKVTLETAPDYMEVSERLVKFYTRNGGKVVRIPERRGGIDMEFSLNDKILA